MRDKVLRRRLVRGGIGGLALAALAGASGVAAAQTPNRMPGQVFRDCATVCPEMVVVPSGSFMMGSTASEDGYAADEFPRHRVAIGHAFAVGRYEVTFGEWSACVIEGGCPEAGNNGTYGAGVDEGWGRGLRPVINVSWHDAHRYVSWLSAKTGQRYRLLSESEWEYAARAGARTRYSTGDTITANDANFQGTGQSRTVPVGSFAPNAFGLYDMHGNVGEWVQDCYGANYSGAPGNGMFSTQGDCSQRVVRGGSWARHSRFLRAAARHGSRPGYRNHSTGFRVARTL